MEEEIKNQEQLQEQKIPQENEYQKYLDSINKLKSNTVSKDEYNKLAEENKTLLDSIVNGQKYAAAESDSAPKYTKEELVKKMLTPGIKSNEFVDTALKFRELVIEETGKDPFVASGHYIQPSPDAQESANRAGEVFAQCLESSSGNSTLFTQGLQNRINDVRLPGVPYKK